MKTLVEKINESIKLNITITKPSKKDFKSEMYKVLADLAFEYENANIKLTKEDWENAIKWFNDKFFDIEDNND